MVKNVEQNFLVAIFEHLTLRILPSQVSNLSWRLSLSERGLTLSFCDILVHVLFCFFIKNGGKRKNKKIPQIPMIGTYAPCSGWRLSSSTPQPRPCQQGHLRGLHIKFQKNQAKNAVSASIWISNIQKSLFFEKNVFAIENNESGVCAHILHNEKHQPLKKGFF